MKCGHCHRETDELYPITASVHGCKLFHCTDCVIPTGFHDNGSPTFHCAIENESLLDKSFGGFKVMSELFLPPCRFLHDV